jgi:erythromycin esterase-like protein
LQDWIAQDAMSFSLDAEDTLPAAVDRMLELLNSYDLRILGFGEALHGGEEILLFRNRMFQRLVERHGFSAIAVESSFPRSRIVNEYVKGESSASLDEVMEAGVSHGFGKLEANRELVEWMRQFNADSSQSAKLEFYGFDQPALTAAPASPKQVLHFVLDYLASVGCPGVEAQRERIDAHLGEDARWENPMAWMDPEKSKPLVGDANALRLEVEDLNSWLQTRRPDFVAGSGRSHFGEARHYAELSRQYLNFFIAMARGTMYADSLGVRDALMADNLRYILANQPERGRLFVFAHNKHLQRGKAEWQIGPMVCSWWPAGAHLDEMFGSEYGVIGSALGTSEDNGIASPEAGTLEAYLLEFSGPVRFVPTYKGQHLPAAAITDLPARSGSQRNPSYFPLNRQSFTDFDGLLAFDSNTYNRGGRPLP